MEGAVRGVVREPDLEKGDPRTEGEKRGGQGEGLTPPVDDTDLGPGPPLCNGFALLRGGGSERSESGYQGSVSSYSGFHQERGGEDAESGGDEINFQMRRESPGRRGTLKVGSGAEGQRGQRDRRESRDPELHQERGGEDAESGGGDIHGKMLRESPGQRGALKEGSGAEGQSLIPRTGPQGTPETSPGEEKRRKRDLLPPTEILRSWWFIVVCALCALLLVLVLTLAALTGHCLSQDVPLPPRIETCPINWLYSGRKCYYFSMMFKKEGDWDESQRVCSSHNGSLALFDTQEELTFLMDLSSEHHTWVGLRKSEDGTHWANGSACSSSLCTITDFGECAFIGFRAIYMSECHFKRPYICSKKPNV